MGLSPTRLFAYDLKEKTGVPVNHIHIISVTAENAGRLCRFVHFSSDDRAIVFAKTTTIYPVVADQSDPKEQRES